MVMAMARGSHLAERAVFAAASAALAGACAFAVANGAAVAGAAPATAAAVATVLAAAVFFVAMAVLKQVAESEPLALPSFETIAIEPRDELLLTDAWLSGSAEDEGDALLLDDVLEPASSDARVIRLFDPQAMPPASAPPDASDALRQALIELRRSLR